MTVQLQELEQVPAVAEEDLKAEKQASSVISLRTLLDTDEGRTAAAQLVQGRSRHHVHFAVDA